MQSVRLPGSIAEVLVLADAQLQLSFTILTAPASGAQFALLPPDNASGNFTKIVQRVPVKICFDEATAGELKSRLAPGMSVIVEYRICQPSL